MAFIILVSSAKQRMTLFVTQKVMLLIKIRNRMGPRTVPCGTPLLHSAGPLPLLVEYGRSGTALSTL